MANDLYSLPLDCASIKLFIAHHIQLQCMNVMTQKNHIVIIVSLSKKVKRSINSGALLPVNHFCK